MYHDELYREAALIVRGREAYLQAATAAWTRFCTWLGLNKG